MGIDQGLRVLSEESKISFGLSPQGHPYLRCSSDNFFYNASSNNKTGPYLMEGTAFDVLHGEHILDQSAPSFDMFLPSIQEYYTLFDAFATGASLSTTITSYQPCHDGAFVAYKNLYYTLRWYSNIANTGVDNSGQNILQDFFNFTTAMSSATSAISLCTTSAEQTQLSLASYIAQF